MLFAAYPSLAGAAESKKVKLLAQNGEGRWFQAPDVPAVSEVVSNFDLATIVGLFARPGVPQAAVDKITAEAIAAANSPGAEKQLRAAGIMHPSSSARSCQRRSRSRRQGLALIYGHAMRGAGFENRRDIHLVAGPPQELAAGHNARVLVLGLLARSDRSDASVSTISSSWAKRTYAES